MKTEVYYWKDIEKMMEIGYKDHPKYPTEEEINKDWVKLPIVFEVKEKDDDKLQELELDQIFEKLNRDDNPMGTKQMQDWIWQNNLKHTSMSVGDIIKNKKGIYVCEDFGWTKII